MAKQIIGWSLLGAGILVIAWGIWATVDIFLGHKQAPQIFDIGSQEEGSETGGSGSSQEEQMKELLQEQLGKMLSAESLAKMFNLGAWSLFMFLLFFAGGKISAIGIKLLNVKISSPAENQPN